MGGTQLEVSLEQYGQTLVAESNLTADWSYVRTENSAACSSLTYPTASSSKHSTVDLTLDDQNQYYCFKTEAGGQTIYQKAEIARQYNLDLKQDDELGRATALDGDWMAVGAPYDDGHSGSNTGAVYLYQKINDDWTLRQEISDKRQASPTCKAVTGLATQSPWMVTPWRLGLMGVVAVIVEPSTFSPAVVALGSLEKEISSTSTVSGFTSSTLKVGDHFGYSVALDGDTLAVGAYGDDGSSSSNQLYGAVYVFTRSGSVWSLQKEISSISTVSGFTSSTLKSHDYFGYSVALDGDTLVVGAYGDDGSSCSSCGAVYIFTRSGTTWSLQKEISSTSTVSGFTSSTLKSYDFFGYSVALDGNTLAVGLMGMMAVVATVNSTEPSMSSPVVVVSGVCKRRSLRFQLYLVLPVVPSRAMTASVTRSLWMVIPWLLGPYGDDGSSSYSQQYGAVYVFTRSGSVWSLQKEISSTSTVSGFTSSTLKSDDYFGQSVALDGDTLAVGAYGDDGSNCSGCGAVYIFTRSGSTWSLDTEVSSEPLCPLTSWQVVMSLVKVLLLTVNIWLSGFHTMTPVAVIPVWFTSISRPVVTGTCNKDWRVTVSAPVETALATPSPLMAAPWPSGLITTTASAGLFTSSPVTSKTTGTWNRKSPEQPTLI